MAPEIEAQRAWEYESLLDFHGDEGSKRKESRLIFKKEEVKLHLSRQGASCTLVDPSLGFSSRSIKCFMQVIPPGRKSGQHRHREEAIVHIVSGNGYSIVDGKKYHWKAGDTLCVPVWAWHQHFNDDPEKPVRFLAVGNVYEMRALGYSEFEQGEDRTFTEDEASK